MEAVRTRERAREGWERRAGEQPDAADEVRAGPKPRPSPLIRVFSGLQQGLAGSGPEAAKRSSGQTDLKPQPRPIQMKEAD